MSAHRNEAHVITGRGARVKHIAGEDGIALCPRSSAARVAEGRFQALPVCRACTKLASEQQEAAESEPASAEDAEPISVHLSARVARYLERDLTGEHPTLAAELKDARRVKCGRGFTAHVTTTTARAATLLMIMKDMAARMESGALKTTGMGFRVEAVEKGIQHVGTGLFYRMAAAA